MDCMQWALCSDRRAATWHVSIPQAVWIACNDVLKFLRWSFLGFNTASGMDCMQSQSWGMEELSFVVSIPQAVWIACNEYQSQNVHGRVDGFNTASGMDCMQYRPSQPLRQLNPEAGFLNGSLFWTNRRNLAGFFCRQNRLKTSATPVISRKLLSTGKI